MPEFEETTAPRAQKPQNNLGIPIAIVIAAGLIAGAIYFSNSGGPTGTTVTPPVQQETPEISVVPISEEDHIRGNPNAPIVLVEYSDFDCPFCKNFHDTMNQVMTVYGGDGKVAWAYRHLPLESLHPNAPKIAEASECVAELAGNDGFWKFTDLVFGERGTNDPTNPERLPEFAERAGADKGKFELCLDNGKYAEKVNNSIQEAIAANGGTNRLGTPFTLVFVGNEYVGPISGAQQFATVKSNIDTILGQIQGGGE